MLNNAPADSRGGPTPGTVEHLVRIPGSNGVSSFQEATYGERPKPVASDPPDSPNPPTRNRH
jgi:hypothetical protein